MYTMLMVVWVFDQWRMEQIRTWQPISWNLIKAKLLCAMTHLHFYFIHFKTLIAFIKLDSFLYSCLFIMILKKLFHLPTVIVFLCLFISLFFLTKYINGIINKRRSNIMKQFSMSHQQKYLRIIKIFSCNMYFHLRILVCLFVEFNWYFKIQLNNLMIIPLMNVICGVTHLHIWH